MIRGMPQPQFGICTPLANAAAARDAGWDFVEEGVQTLLQGLVPDADWSGAERARTSALPIPVCNGLVPADLKITGPTADPARLAIYMDTVFRRAQLTGIRYLVFGSGAARGIPEGFDRAAAYGQLREFARTSADLAAQYNVTLVAEPLNTKECNVLTTLAETLEFVQSINHPHLKVLVDTYHFWFEREPLERVNQAFPYLAHVHVADLNVRVAPGEGKPPSDYRPLFRLLKDAGYSGMISVEALDFAPPDYQRVRTFLRDQWSEA
jgi:sugar phosphate isomerase/epimerase